jgi:hypothetical protein
MVAQHASKLSQQEFIEKARQIHGDRYDYSLTHYKTSSKGHSNLQRAWRV